MSRVDITLVNVTTAMPSDKNNTPDIYLPLGCLYLVGALERAGIEVDFRDYQLFSKNIPFPLDVDCFQRFLSDSAPIVGISCMVSMLPFVLLGTKKFKEYHPGHTIILGGPGPSGVATEIISMLPWIDIVVRGEGEATLVELLGALKGGSDLATIAGITYRNSADCCHNNEPRSRIMNLDELPLPAYGKVNLSEYTSVAVITGRGCSYGCTFCDVGPLWNNKALFRSIGSVIEELNLLKSKFAQKHVNIADDTFDLRKRRVESFCEEVKELNLNWSCLARIDLMDEELLDKIARSGCRSIFLGIESGSNTILKTINKRFTIQEATKKVEMATQYIENVITSYIWGFPFETMEDFEKTILSVFSMLHLGAMVGLKLLSPMPLSQLGIEYKDQLEFSEDLCSVFASLGNVIPGTMSRRAEIPDEFKDFIRMYPDIFAGFYYIKSGNIKEKSEYLRNFSEKLGISP